MHAVINQQRIPDATLNFVILSMGGGVNITGEAVNEEQRIAVDRILQSLHDGETVEFDVEDRDYHPFHGAGRITRVERNEEGVGTLMRIRFSIAIQYVH